MATTEESHGEEYDSTSESMDDTNVDDPQFEPIVSLPEQEIKTLEEDEEELFKMRVKLFRFASENDLPEWKERGTGDVKLLRHKEKGTIRLLMRQDKTLKICANHYITPLMELKPNAGSDRAWVWNTHADFADESPKPELLAIRFLNAENAQKFKAKFEECKKELKKPKKKEESKIVLKVESRVEARVESKVESKVELKVEPEEEPEEEEPKEEPVEEPIEEKAGIVKERSCDQMAKKLEELSVKDGDSESVPEIRVKKEVLEAQEAQEEDQEEQTSETQETEEAQEPKSQESEILEAQN
ncbi:LOW QUALITY PROTEIN: ran-specific GTPase-activating protein-like [Gracilinanus agilis]|uniref:LOW QUALITY PROTEIN: ran-specific GTPase-activating protein-like n=1 Tax=Gracilinanus agilis TaxID=191870 RepID=UPI001CFE409C|nr:LOW QUALITY PROTEIN: ran-specific GTPase-activating protein-like [Gracilinanus agilis]